MNNIYQRIYDKDIEASSGIPAFVKGSGDTTSDTVGYVIVNESRQSEHITAEDLFDSVVIPPSKQLSFDLAEALFDNYNLDSSERDEITFAEQEEVRVLLTFVQDRPPMVLAREFLAETTGHDLADEQWTNLIIDTWFRPFEVEGSPTRSGFEHVFLGEKTGSKVGGLHWWYFYHKKSGSITYEGTVYNEETEGMAVPEVATMEFSWEVDGGTIRKPKGGFFVGLSVEGLMAMGMVCAHQNMTRQQITLQGAKLELVMYKSNDGRSINTFYPKFKGLVEATNTRSNAFRLISALANPAGHDPGNEKITVMNVFGNASESLLGWGVFGPNGTSFEFGDISLDVGEAKTFVLPSTGSMQLSNQGGTISVKDPQGNLQQEVTYVRDIAKMQGAVLLWDGNRHMLNVS